MENWLMYALLSILAGGLFSFGMKIISARNLNVHFVSCIGYTVVVLISGLYYYFYELESFNYDNLSLIVLFGFLNAALYYASTVTRVIGLKNIDTTIFLPVYMTLFPVILTMVSVLLYSEPLEVYEWIGIGMGICVPLLLITKREFGIQTNLKLGVILIFITSLLGAASAVFPKQIHEIGYNIDLYVFISSCCGMVFSGFSYYITTRKKSGIKVKNSSRSIIFAMLLGCIQYAAFICFVRAISGNLAIAVTINSFHILIPIILSVIFYKEEMTIKKAFVIFLSIVSVILFI